MPYEYIALVFKLLHNAAEGDFHNVCACASKIRRYFVPHTTVIALASDVVPDGGSQRDSCAVDLAFEVQLVAESSHGGNLDGNGSCIVVGA